MTAHHITADKEAAPEEVENGTMYKQEVKE